MNARVKRATVKNYAEFTTKLWNINGQSSKFSQKIYEMNYDHSETMAWFYQVIVIYLFLRMNTFKQNIVWPFFFIYFINLAKSLKFSDRSARKLTIMHATILPEDILLLALNVSISGLISVLEFMCSKMWFKHIIFFVSLWWEWEFTIQNAFNSGIFDGKCIEIINIRWMVAVGR